MVLLLLLAAALVPSAAASPSFSSSIEAATTADLVLTGGAALAANPLLSLRSGEPQALSSATFAVPLAAGAVLTSVSFDYRYTTGFAGGNGSNFSLAVGHSVVYRSPQLADFPYLLRGGPNVSYKSFNLPLFFGPFMAYLFTGVLLFWVHL